MKAVLNTDRWNINPQFAKARSRIWDVIEDDGSRICQVVIKPGEHHGTVQMGREGQLTFRDEAACAMEAHKALLAKEALPVNDASIVLNGVQQKVALMRDGLGNLIKHEDVNIDLTVALIPLYAKLREVSEMAAAIQKNWSV